MKIKLHNHYRNVSGVTLEPGEYNTSDKRLTAQLVQYLITSGDASVITGDPSPIATDGNAVFYEVHESVSKSVSDDYNIDSMMALDEVSEPVTEPISDELVSDTLMELHDVDRDTLMELLEESGIEYSKFWSTDKLREALENN